MKLLLTSAGISGPAYAIDDQTALRVTDDTVDVVSEGHWELLTPLTATPAHEWLDDLVLEPLPG